MASMFSFGFSGDDIEDDIDAGVTDTTTITHTDDDNDKNNNQTGSADNYPPKVFPAEKHPIAEWTSSLPSQIAYNTLKLENARKEQLILGRREIFDVRTQLMAEDAPDHDELISGLEQGDLKPNFYEGGFKTWECALDLARMVLASATDRDDGNDDDDDDDDEFHVIELGCGTAVPTLALFARLLSLLPEERRKKGGCCFRFTLADYNSAVLRMVTLPNLLLTWWLNTTRISQSDDGGSTTEETQKPDEGELDIDSTLITAFQTDLSNRGISIDFISGGWSPHFVNLVFGGDHHHEEAALTGKNTLILASETIYSPPSLGAFSQTLVQLLRRAQGARRKSRSLVAAKKVYFGVGGGIDEFLHVLRQQPLQENEQLDTRESSEVTSEGVGRIILEVSIRTTAST